MMLLCLKDSKNSSESGSVDLKTLWGAVLVLSIGFILACFAVFSGSRTLSDSERDVILSLVREVQQRFPEADAPPAEFLRSIQNGEVELASPLFAFDSAPEMASEKALFPKSFFTVDRGAQLKLVEDFLRGSEERMAGESLTDALAIDQ